MSKELLQNRFPVLDYPASLEAVIKSELSPGQKHLTQLLLEKGRSFMVQFQGSPEPTPIIDVTRFLNHRVNGNLLRLIKNELGPKLIEMKPDVILTAAASGIAPAVMEASFGLNGQAIDIVYARKDNPPITMNEAGVFQIDSRSYTADKPVKLLIAKDSITPDEQAVISDEFLDLGVTARGLAQLIQTAGAQLTGAVFIIEKSFSGGREFLKQQLGLTDEQIISLLVIETQGEGWMKIRGVDNILTFQRQTQKSNQATILQ